MELYLLIIATFILDIITMKKSNNSKDKIPYVISMILVCALGVLYLKFGDEIQLVDRLFKLLRIQGGV